MRADLYTLGKALGWEHTCTPRLHTLVGYGVARVTGRGLWAGVHITPGGPTGHMVAETLMVRGVLCKETQTTTLRTAPPL